MSRLKLLVVAAVIGGAGWSYLTTVAQRDAAQVRSDADRQLRTAQAALAPDLERAAADQLATAKTLAADPVITQAFDDQNHPTSAALEMAVSSLSKAPPTGATKPDLLVLVSHGAAARYRVGASNRFDKDDSAFKALGPVGGPRALVATLEGTPYQLAVAPLAMADPSAPPVGQLALGYALGDGFAKKLETAAGVDVSLVAGHKVVASTLAAADKASLPTAIRPGASLDFGQLAGEQFGLVSSVPVRLPLGSAGAAANHAVALPLGGQDVVAVLSVRVSRGYAKLAEDQRLVIAWLAGIIALCLILAAFGSNPTKGLPQIAAVADKIAQGDLTLRAPTEKLSPGVRRIAVALNAIVAQAAAHRSASTPPKPAAQPSVDSLLQAAASPEAAAEAAPEVAPPPPAPAPAAEPPAASPIAASMAPNGSPKPAAKPPPAPTEDDFGGLFDAPVKAAPPPPPPPPAMPSLGDDADTFNPDATVVAAVPEALVRATRGTTPPAPPRGDASAPVPLPAPAASAEETHFQTVFREFVSTREKCGEPADGLTYDKFVVKLRKNREQLVSKYACKSVRFQVYVKEGKAALKATPVRK